MARLLPSDTGLELEAEKVVRSVEEIRDDLRRKGINVPLSLFDDTSASEGAITIEASSRELETLLREKQLLEARLAKAEAEVEVLRHLPKAKHPIIGYVPPPKPILEVASATTVDTEAE